jgi:hypothetical protein
MSDKRSRDAADCADVCHHGADLVKLVKSSDDGLSRLPRIGGAADVGDHAFAGHDHASAGQG